MAEVRPSAMVHGPPAALRFDPYIPQQFRVHFLDTRHIATDARVQLHRNFSIDRQLHIFDQLPCAHFDGEHARRFRCITCQGIAREWPKRDRTEQTGADTLRPRQVDDRAQYARNDAVADKQDLGVVGLVSLEALFQLLRDLVLRLELAHMLLEIVGLQEDRADQVVLRLRSSLHRPGLVDDRDLLFLDLDRFHHLPDESVSEHYGGIAIAVRQLEGEDGEVEHLLHRRRSEHQVAIAAVAAALHHAEVIALFGRDVPETGATAYYVEDNH